MCPLDAVTDTSGSASELDAQIVALPGSPDGEGVVQVYHDGQWG